MNRAKPSIVSIAAIFISLLLLPAAASAQATPQSAAQSSPTALITGECAPALADANTIGGIVAAHQTSLDVLVAFSAEDISFINSPGTALSVIAADFLLVADELNAATYHTTEGAQLAQDWTTLYTVIGNALTEAATSGAFLDRLDIMNRHFDAADASIPDADERDKTIEILCGVDDFSINRDGTVSINDTTVPPGQEAAIVAALGSSGAPGSTATASATATVSATAASATVAASTVTASAGSGQPAGQIVITGTKPGLSESFEIPAGRYRTLLDCGDTDGWAEFINSDPNANLPTIFSISGETLEEFDSGTYVVEITFCTTWTLTLTPFVL